MTEMDDAFEARFDGLLAEVRRQGRAAVAAQAAAEQCLEALTTRGDGRHARSACDGSRADATSLEALLPTFDAIDRLVSTANAMREQTERAPWLVRRWAPSADNLGALAEGLSLLQRQLAVALDGMGVTVDRPLRESFDATRHRAVETRRGRANEVLEVQRPGYWLGDELIREAEVVVGHDDVTSDREDP